jgi:SRSO17 transposase
MAPVAGKITNCQIGVFAAYVSRHGHAVIDRALYLPKGGTDDPARLKATYVQGDIDFSTKPQLAAEMIERALAAGVPFRWVAADSVYGTIVLRVFAAFMAGWIQAFCDFIRKCVSRLWAPFATRDVYVR